MTLVPIFCDRCSAMVGETELEPGQPITQNTLYQAKTLKAYSVIGTLVLCEDCQDVLQ